MKTYIPAVLLLLFVTISFVSCDFVTVDKGGAQSNQSGENNTDNGDEIVDGDFIWSKGSEISVVSSESELADDDNSSKYARSVSNIYSMIGSFAVSEGIKLNFVPDSNEPTKHEIVLGRSSREVSKRAYELLDAQVTEDDEVGWLIYSDGYSVALAFDYDIEYLALDEALAYFKDNLVSEALTLEAGVCAKRLISINEVHQKRDDELVASRWEAFEKKIYTEMRETMNDSDARKYTEDMISALEQIYALYSDDLIDWFAGLYEPYVCVCEGDTCQKTRYCGGSGFYYSNSARDNDYVTYNGGEYMLLPDAETTAQALGFIASCGMLNQIGSDLKNAFPEGEGERMIRFIKALQDEESGYFYHPQWLSLVDTDHFWDSRRSRDMNYSLSVLRFFGSAPTYTTPTSVPGDGILYDGTDLNVSATADHLASPLKTSLVTAVSKVVLASSEPAVHPHLVSEGTFTEYLATLDLEGNSYYVGNELASLAPQIVARDNTLGTEDNPRPLATILDNWFRYYQDTETGHWHKNNDAGYRGYYAINGLLKISACYNTLKLEFPNPLAAARSAFAIIASEEPINHVCDLYNTWFTISNIISNINAYSDDKALAKQIVSEVRVDAIPAVIATAEKMKGHLKDDGSFSYFANRSSATSQNMPVAIPNTNEGDVNATNIFTYGILGYLFSALDFGSAIDVYTECDRERFISLIEEKIASCDKRQAEAAD